MVDINDNPETVFYTYKDVRENNPKWSDRMIEDYLSLKRDIDTITENTGKNIDDIKNIDAYFIGELGRLRGLIDKLKVNSSDYLSLISLLTSDAGKLKARIANSEKVSIDLYQLFAGITSDIGKLRSIVTQKSEPWRIPTLLNSWVNSGGGRTDTLYYKDKTGAVHIVGSIKDGTVGSPIFTLPVGYRPLKTQYIPASDDVGAIYLDVDSSGNVTLPFGSNTFVYFSGAIRAEQ